jgi:dihydrofolate reductase
MIVAMARNRVIGRDGDLPWRLSDDLRRFKRLTMGHHLIMGRRTFESIGRPLPGRTSIVITKQEHYIAEGATVAHSLPAALKAARFDEEAFVIGGAQIYSLAIPHVDRVYLTLIEADAEGDTRFPEVDWAQWSVTSSEEFPASENNEYPHQFRVLDRHEA